MSGTFPVATPRRPIDAFLAAATAAMDRPLADRPRVVADALADWLHRADLLEHCDCTPRPDRYARRLIHADPAGRFSVLSLVWCPGQASPVHAHRVWCAFGVHAGVLSESHFQPAAGESMPTLHADHERRAGDCAHGPAAPDLIHRLANRCAGTAVSVHVYGIGLDGVETGVNRIYA